MSYNRIDDKIGISKNLKDVEIGNNGLGEGKNQDIWYAIIEDAIDFDNRDIDMVDLTDRVFANILTYFFGL